MSASTRLVRLAGPSPDGFVDPIAKWQRHVLMNNWSEEIEKQPHNQKGPYHARNPKHYFARGREMFRRAEMIELAHTPKNTRKLRALEVR
ncbi:hypothetical protein SAMN05518861_12540 [Mesorhizobium sp. YR577]|nr:hypothetical protein SAMN05518861_12540 [Mesorhizobium sp. YR577]